VELTKRIVDDWTEVTIEGRLDGYWAEHLDAGLADAVRTGHHRLRLDLSAVPFLSSAGIAVLVKYYKRLGAIHGALVIAAASAQVRSVLDMTRLTGMLVSGPAAPPPQTVTIGSAFVSHGVVCELFDAQAGARFRCRTFGADRFLGAEAGATEAAAALSCPDSTLAIGIGTFDGAGDAQASSFGEFLAVAGAAACVPADGAEAPDYLVASESQAPEIRASRYLACDGAFARHFRFDGAPSGTPITMARLAELCLDFGGGAAAGMVVVAETSGLVGAGLKQAPPADFVGDLFEFPAVRSRLTFTAERAYPQALALVVGVVQRPGPGPVPAEHLRPLDRDGTLAGHFHAAAFPFRPFKKGRLELGVTVRDLFEERAVQGVLHLLHDDRPITGVGQSEFLRGACWLSPIEA